MKFHQRKASIKYSNFINLKTHGSELSKRVFEKLLIEYKQKLCTEIN